MVDTVLPLLVTGLAVLGLLAVRRHWRAADRVLDHAEAELARIDRDALRRRLHGQDD
jgi:hypothetical protein